MSTWRRPYSRTYQINSTLQSESYQPALESLNKRSAKHTTRHVYTVKETEEALSAAKSKLVEMEKEDKPIRTPLCDKHPYYFPVESVYTLPHEGSEWPESRPHFDLVSSYDVMVGYLGLRPQDKKAREPTK